MEPEDLVKQFQLSGDIQILRMAIDSYRQLGMDDQANDLEFEYLRPELIAYDTAWNQFRQLKYRVPYFMHVAELANAYQNLEQMRVALKEKAEHLGLPPAQHVYRRYDIPDTNNHLEKLATLYNATKTYTARDDDSYFGECLFTSIQDAESFVEAMKRHHSYFGDEARISHVPDGFQVEWHVYK